MTIQEAKSISLDNFLLMLGYTSVKTQTGELWYHSPFRNERTPSFKLSRDRGAWFDHGEGLGGNIIDLAMRLNQTDSIFRTLQYIEKVMGSSDPISRKEQAVIAKEESKYQLISQEDFIIRQGDGLTLAASYLKDQRKLDLDSFGPYLKTVYYFHINFPQKRQTGFAIPNISGGFEVRTFFQDQWLKRSVGKKDISVFYANRKDWENAPWLCFYSMMDFGTFLTIDFPPIGVYNYLIINGDGLVDKTIHYLQNIHPGYIIHFPHMDSSGQKAFYKLSQFAIEKGWQVKDQSIKYEGYKDWGEKLQVEGEKILPKR